jgi:hypothetical protein
MLRVSGSLQKSGEVMKLVNESIKLPEMQKTMFEMSKGEGQAWRLLLGQGGSHALCRGWDCSPCLSWFLQGSAAQQCKRT